MFKLLGAYFSRLSKWLIFRILLLLMLIGGIGVALLMRKITGAWNVPYMMAYLMFPHYVGVVIGLFNYPLFTNGTIRNQLSVGHRRSHIYLADWAVSNLFSVVLYLVFTVGFLITLHLCGEDITAGQNPMPIEGLPSAMEVNPEASASLKAVLCGVTLSVMQIIFFTTVTQLFCVMLKGVKSFLAIYLGNQMLVIGSMGIAALSGKYGLPDMLLNLLPSVVCMRQSSFAVDPDFWPGLLATIAETVIVYVLGSLYFRRTDIN